MANSLKLYEMHSLSISPNSRQCTTVLNADEVENECTSYNFRQFAIFVLKIVGFGGSLT